MISVIIPTMWKADVFKVMIPLLLDHDKIGEVIIIDNDVSARFSDLPNHSKIKLLGQKENIYVNAAWNLGAETSLFDKLCIMNDDVVFDINVFDYLYDKITEKIGTIGPGNSSIKHFYLKSPNLHLEVLDKLSVTNSDFTRGYGTLLFLHKNNYLKIPDELVVDFGDAFLYDYNSLQKRQNYKIVDFCIKTKMCTTSSSSSHIFEIKKKELDSHIEIFKKYLTPKVKKGKLLSPPIVGV